MNLWYLIAGLAFVGAGIYKIITNNGSVGVTWVVIGILFGLLARFNNNKDHRNGRKR